MCLGKLLKVKLIGGYHVFDAVGDLEIDVGSASLVDLDAQVSAPIVYELAWYNSITLGSIYQNGNMRRPGRSMRSGCADRNTCSPLTSGSVHRSGARRFMPT